MQAGGRAAALPGLGKVALHVLQRRALDAADVVTVGVAAAGLPGGLGAGGGAFASPVGFAPGIAKQMLGSVPVVGGGVQAHYVTDGLFSALMGIVNQDGFLVMGGVALHQRLFAGHANAGHLVAGVVVKWVFPGAGAVHGVHAAHDIGSIAPRAQRDAQAAFVAVQLPARQISPPPLDGITLALLFVGGGGRRPFMDNGGNGFAERWLVSQSQDCSLVKDSSSTLIAGVAGHVVLHNPFN